MKTHIDLNSDLGEGFGPWEICSFDEASLFPLISSANVATGFHAGDPGRMRRCVELAKQYGVGIGAHPAYRDLWGFGRRHLAASPAELVNEMLYQVGALRELAKLCGARLSHVKPHGALYMHLARDADAARAVVSALRQVSPETPIYCLAPSVIHDVAREMGQPVVREFYADRDYDKNASIVFVRKVGALEPQAVAKKILKACVEGKVRTVDNAEIAIEFDSICIHSDTPGAYELIQSARAALEEKNIAITAP